MKNINIDSQRKIYLRYTKKIDCNVSTASNEIMLNRIFNGNKLEFPFSNNLKQYHYHIYSLVYLLIKYKNIIKKTIDYKLTLHNKLS